MAFVYRAHDPALERDVALKLLPAEFLHEREFAERFRQEARIAGRLEHPHIVPVHAFGIEKGGPWMAMRLVQGGSLAERLRRGPVPPRLAAALLRDVADALDYAHERGIVHRDVKPANVLLDGAGRGYLADFGIARILEGSAITSASGMVQGTPAYMAPEQATGQKVDHFADVYALGVVAFECLTGRVPYRGTSPVAILMKHIHEPVPEASPGEVVPAIAAVLRRCLAKSPAERWPSAGAFAAALEEASEGVSMPSLESLPTLETPSELLPEGGAAPEPVAPETRTIPPDIAPPPPAPPATGRFLLWAAAAAAVVGVLAVLGVAGALLLSGLWPSGSAPAVAPRPISVLSAPPTPRPTPSATATTLPDATPQAAPHPTPRARVPSPKLAATSAPVTTPAAEPKAVVESRAEPRAAPARSGPVRVYLEAKLEPLQFHGTEEEDVDDSLRDLEDAMRRRSGLTLAPTRGEADAVVQVLERGREPAVIGMRKLRVRVLAGPESVELVGQDSLKSFNTWSGAAASAAKQIEVWLSGRLGPQ